MELIYFCGPYFIFLLNSKWKIKRLVEQNCIRHKVLMCNVYKLDWEKWTSFEQLWLRKRQLWGAVYSHYGGNILHRMRRHEIKLRMHQRILLILLVCLQNLYLWFKGSSIFTCSMPQLNIYLKSGWIRLSLHCVRHAWNCFQLDRLCFSTMWV